MMYVGLGPLVYEDCKNAEGIIQSELCEMNAFLSRSTDFLFENAPFSFVAFAHYPHEFASHLPRMSSIS